MVGAMNKTEMDIREAVLVIAATCGYSNTIRITAAAFWAIGLLLRMTMGKRS